MFQTDVLPSGSIVMHDIDDSGASQSVFNISEMQIFATRFCTLCLSATEIDCLFIFPYFSLGA